MSNTNSQTTPLYPGKIPNSKNVADEEKTEQTNGVTIVSKISKPTITVFKPAPDKATGAAVIIFPGGGYWVNAVSHEGTDVAETFVKAGITAFVVKYRVPDERTMMDPSIGPLQDAQQAIITVRNNALQHGIDPHKIGVMGFSAGGHLASTLGTHYKKVLVDNPGQTSARPDFLILIYPVISADDSYAHHGSFEQLLGKKATPEQRLLYSNEKQVTSDTPPAYLVHASDDDAVPVQNSIRFYEALLKNKVPAEMHIYEKGGHGFGMINPTTTDRWMDHLVPWINSRQ